MLKFQCFNVLGKTGLLLFLVILFPVFLFMSCTTPHQPKEDYQLALIEKQVDEMDKKIDEIYHRVSVIQFMVDNHERFISDLEKGPNAAKLDESATVPGAEPGTESVQPMSTVTTDQVSNQVPGQMQGQVMAEPIISSSLLPEPVQESAQAEPKPQPAPDITESPQMLYNRALSKYKNADYQDAALMFNRFVQKYPGHELADNALYWEGECGYALKNFSKAIATFQRVINEYQDGSKVPDAMLKTGYAYLSVGDRENARIYLKKVVKNYPFSPAGTKAEMMLKKIK